MGLEHLYVKAQVIFLFGSHRRDVAIQLLHTRKDFVQEQERRFVRIRLEFVAKSIVDKSAAVFQLFLGGLRHFADNRFRHPFAPLVNRKREFRRGQLRNQVVGQLQRNAVVFLGGIKDHLAHHHAAGAVETFNAELFYRTAKSGLEVGALRL